MSQMSPEERALAQAAAGLGISLPTPGAAPTARSATGAGARPLPLRMVPRKLTQARTITPLDASPDLPALDEMPPDWGPSTEREHLAQTPTGYEEAEMSTADEAFLQIRRMTDPEFMEVASKLVKAGLIDEDYTREEVEKAWKDLVDKAADWYAVRPEDNATPLDMLDLYYQTAPGSTANPEGSGPRAKTVVDRQIKLSSNTEARALLSNMLVRELGRRPTGKEIDDFQAALNEAQRANPFVTTTTTTTDPSGGGTQVVMNDGGLDVEEFTNDRIAGDRSLESEWGAYQASTTYYNALLQALEGPVGM